jgi:hypothetical protein
MDKETGLRTKKEYLTVKLKENERQLARKNTLIQKYNERIFTEQDNQQLIAERDFLVKEREKLLKQNQEMKELLAL